MESDRPHSEITIEDSLMDIMHAGKPSFLLYNDGNDKENCITNNLEVPKTSLDSHNLKKRKKDVRGYNLHSSMAWDRAFFTEEGVLEPLELSMITGCFGNSSGKVLSLIDEGRISLPGNLDSAENSVHLQELNLLKESSERTKIDCKKSTGCQLQKYDSPDRNKIAPVTSATQSVLSSHGVFRSGSKSHGRPRQLVSSLKSPANVNKTKSTMNDQTSTTSKSAVVPHAIRTKHNQNAQPDANNLMYTELKTPRRSNIVQNSSEVYRRCMSLPAKSSFHLNRRNMVQAYSPLEFHSSIKSKVIPVTQPKNCLKVSSDFISCSGKKLSHKSRNIALSRLQSSENLSGDIGYAQVQMGKPSGLRMPAPSLGFFSVTKASTSQIPPLRNTQLDNLSKFSIPNLERVALIPLEEPAPTHAPVEKSKVVNRITENGDTTVFSSGANIYVSSTKSPILLENIKSDLEIKILKKGEVQDSYDSKVCESLINQKVPYILDAAERKFQGHERSYANISNDGSKLQTECDILLSKRKSSEKATNDSRKSPRNEIEDPISISQIRSVIQNDVSRDDHMAGYFFYDGNPNHSSVKCCISPSRSESGHGITDRSAFAHHNNSISLAHDIIELSGEEAKPCICKNDYTANKDNKNSENSCKFVSRGTVDVSTIRKKATEIDEGSFHSLCIEQCTEQTSYGAVEVDDDMVKKSSEEDAEIQSLNDTIYSVRNLSTSIVVNHCSLSVDNLTIESKEPVLQQNLGLCSNSRLLLENSSSCMTNILDRPVFIVPEKTDACEGKLVSFDKCSVIGNTMDNDGIGENKITGHLFLGDTLSKIDKRRCHVTCSETELSLTMNESPTSAITKVIQECSEPVCYRVSELENQTQGFPAFQVTPPIQMAGVDVDKLISQATSPEIYSSLKASKNQLKVRVLNSPKESDAKLFYNVSPHSEREKSQDANLRRPSLKVPFSDEWLTAIEAAGEEILSIKTGAVQHSPTDKSPSEPSPWSPVKRKNSQVIGPFDCTKCTSSLSPFH